MSQRRLLLVLLAVLTAGAIAAGIAVAAESNGSNKTFEYAIGLWGDMPYSDTQAQTGVPNLIADMNNSDLAFSVQDGDLKAGRGTPGSATPTTCATATPPALDIYTQALGYFNSLKEPAIFTPGDNDWTDCDRSQNGSFNAMERLQHERQLFFSTDQSLGQKTMTLEVQTAPLCHGWDYQTNTEVTDQPCVENRRWTYKRVTYATLNVQGTCNNLCGSGAPDTTGNPAEYAARNTAKQWLQETFDEAKAEGSAGVMIIWQGDPGFDATKDAVRGTGYQGAPVRDPVSLAETDGNPNGFQDILLRLRSLTIDFKKPVVLVHGDSHYFMVDKPLLDSQGRQVENFTRVETFGDNAFSSHPEWDNNHVHWVKALVDPNSRDVFAFQAQTVPENRVAVPAP